MNKRLKLTELDTTAGTQIRAAIDEATVAEYGEAMRAGAQFPPVVVFQNGGQCILADGFHRALAAACEGMTEIEAEVRPGARSDALKYALGANVAHGLRRTNADKRRSVELALAEWPRLSDRQLADICAVSHSFVNLLRPQLSTVDSCPPVKRLGADGRQRQMPRPRPQPVEPHITLNERNEPPAMPDTCRIKTLDDETVALPAETPDLESEVEYHLHLVRADAEIILARLGGQSVEPGDLDDCAVELRFAARKVEALKSHLEWQGQAQAERQSA